MAYEPHVWVDKEVITAEKLNNLEEGAKAKSIPGPQGAAGPQGEPGPKGDGFTGEPVTLGTRPARNHESSSGIRGGFGKCIRHRY